MKVTKNAYGMFLISIEAKNGGQNPKKIFLDAEVVRDDEEYGELRIGASIAEKYIADILVGLDEEGNLRVLVSGNSDCDEHRLAIFPERSSSDPKFIEKWKD